MKASDLVREIAPYVERGNDSILNEALADDIGEVKVVRTDELELGILNLGGKNPALVVVEMVTVSRTSGGEMYTASAIHTPKADHYVVDGLPSVIAEPIRTGQQGSDTIE